MIEFQGPQPEDKGWIDQLLSQQDNRGCEYNFTSLFVWQKGYHQKVARYQDFLLTQVCGTMGCSYLYPIGAGDVVQAIELLRQQVNPCETSLKLVCVSQGQREALERLMPGVFTFAEDRDGFDYLYDINRLADLPGKKLHAKRNHINRFMERYPDWCYEEITQENLAECMAMDEDWNRQNLVDADATTEEELRAEVVAIRSAMKHYQLLGLEGGLLRVEGKVVAFTIGDRLTGDTYDVHFEKAYAEMQGAYALINREYARWLREKHPEVKYLNREDDMGIEGLRRAKLSYYPDLMVEKFTATAYRW